jgi:chromosome segregation ATPase
MNEELISLRDEMREGFAEMRREMRQGFEGLRGEVSGLRADVVELRQDVIALRVRIEVLEQRVGALEQGVGVLEQRVGVLEQRVTANGVMLEALRDQVRPLAQTHAFLAAQVERQTRRQDVTNKQLALLRASYSELDRRVTRLEPRPGRATRACSRLPGTSHA